MEEDDTRKIEQPAKHYRRDRSLHQSDAMKELARKNLKIIDRVSSVYDFRLQGGLQHNFLRCLLRLLRWSASWQWRADDCAP